MDEIEVTGSRIKRVEQINYVGKVLSDNSSIAGDVDSCCDSLLRQFNGLYHKFKFLDMNILHFLFISCCMSLYGIEMWYDKLKSQKQYKRISVTYHRAIKQMCGMQFWDNIHVACDKLNLDIFKHLLVKR